MARVVEHVVLTQKSDVRIQRFHASKNLLEQGEIATLTLQHNRVRLWPLNGR
jgi:hypothetical protein